MLKIVLLLAVLPFSKGFAQQADAPLVDPVITSEDLKMLIGKWQGSLTYIDYRTNKPFTMPANLSVTVGANKNQLTLYNIYPNERKANSKSKLTISESGDRVNKKPILSKLILPDGLIQFITEYKGKDNKEKALIRNIYLVSANQFVIRKEVQFENSQDWIKRNEFKYSR